MSTLLPPRAFHCDCCGARADAYQGGGLCWYFLDHKRADFPGAKSKVRCEGSSALVQEDALSQPHAPARGIPGASPAQTMPGGRDGADGPPGGSG